MGRHHYENAHRQTEEAAGEPQARTADEHHIDERKRQDERQGGKRQAARCGVDDAHIVGCHPRIAKEYGLKTFMIGQTVGPFNKYAREVYRLVLDNIDGCFFRDIESIKDTKSLGYNCLPNVVPDIALGEETLYVKSNYIAFIPSLTDLNRHMEDIIRNMQSIVAESGYKVIITVSQQWSWSLQVATSFYIAMINKGIEVKYVIPEDYKELERILSSAQFVFSQNLHGLILAYRGHTPIACLNNRRKFVSFMKIINHEENLISPSNITSTNLYDCFKRRREFDFSNCQEFQHQIKEAINQTLC